MKKFLKWVFIICTLGVGLVFWPWLFPKLDDKDKCYQVCDLMVNMWVGKKVALAAIETVGGSLYEHYKGDLERGKYGVLSSFWVTARQLEFIRQSDAFITDNANYRTADSGWKDFD